MVHVDYAVVLGLAVAAKALHYLYELLTIPKPMKVSLALPRPVGTLPLIGNTLQTAQHFHRIHDWFLEQSQVHGGNPFYLCMFGAQHLLVVAKPEFFEDINKTHFESFDKGPLYADLMRDVLGEGIFAVDGDKWYQQRKTVSNLFTQRGLRDNLTASVCTSLVPFHRILQRAVDNKEAVDLAKLFFRFSTETFVDFGLGAHMGMLEAEEDHPFQAAFDNAEHVLLHRFFRPPWVWKALRWLNIGLEKEIKESVRVINDTIFGIISKSMATRDEKKAMGRKDIVSLFIDSFDHKSLSEKFEPAVLRDIIVSILVAGRDSTAVTMSWFFYLLSDHPHVEAKIIEELLEHAPELMRGEVEALGMEDSQKLVYLEAALRETTRLFPAIPLNMKTANKDVVLHDGTFVGKGWSVIYASYTMGRMENVWGPDATQFKPERWLHPTTGKLLTFSPFKFTSFHSGPRVCLGMTMAIMEMRIVISSLLSKFRVRVVPKRKVTYDFALILQMKDPLMVTIEPAGHKGSSPSQQPHVVESESE
ncbi:Cytochrome p450 86a2 [Globisporangium polare]